MILLVNPRATRPKNRRFPLSVMALGAALPDGVSWEVIDGNRPAVDPLAEISAHVAAQARTRDPVRAIALTVMPGPQLVNAVPLSRQLKARFPAIPLIWGGYFPSLYPTPVLRAPYVDWIVRGQGEQTFRELLDVIDGTRDPRTVPGLAFRDAGTHVVNPERRWVGPDELPAPPYHKIDVDDYLIPTVLGRRCGVYQSSIGCPYSCSFCAVISVFGSREKVQQPARTAAHLEYLVRRHGMDGVHFYDNNFFVREDHALELCERMAPLNLAWWCEARIDAMLRFSDSTWRKLRRAGLKMVFFGAESGDDAVLRRMDKRLTAAQTLEIAHRTREHGITPEFSFVLGDRDEPELALESTLALIRRLKLANPAMELITYYYTPTPQRRIPTYGNVDPLAGTPDDLEEWIQPEWVEWMTHENPRLPWLTPQLRARLDDFRTVFNSRYPSVHAARTPPWRGTVVRLLAARRWRTGNFSNPWLLRTLRRWATAVDTQAYGHLRPGA